jgi:hypothetical protein
VPSTSSSWRTSAWYCTVASTASPPIDQVSRPDITPARGRVGFSRRPGQTDRRRERACRQQHFVPTARDARRSTVEAPRLNPTYLRTCAGFASHVAQMAGTGSHLGVLRVSPMDAAPRPVTATVRRSEIWSVMQDRCLVWAEPLPRVDCCRRRRAPTR